MRGTTCDRSLCDQRQQNRRQRGDQDEIAGKPANRQPLDATRQATTGGKIGQSYGQPIKGQHQTQLMLDQNQREQKDAPAGKPPTPPGQPPPYETDGGRFLRKSLQKPCGLLRFGDDKPTAIAGVCRHQMYTGTRGGGYSAPAPTD